MAELRIVDKQGATKETITDQARIASELGAIGIVFETWGVDRLPAQLKDRNLSDDEKRQVLEYYKPEIDRMRARGGYVTSDVISLYPDTPNLDAICAKFDKKHLHTEDEVRFVVQGRGVFRLYPVGRGDALDVELRPGDFISVPAKYDHLFYLCADKKITCIRLFVDPAGWVAHYVPETAGAK
ncbi:MAG: cupin domain-containing protein [Planctomycetes bacterium]|nr:cupin domain-containing protein [Planctomycetota bacterium]